MNTRSMLIIVASVLLAPHARGQDAATRDLQKLQGGWALVSVVMDGKDQTDDYYRSYRVFIKEGAWMAEYVGQAPMGRTVPMKIKLDPGKNPKAIDFAPATGEGGPARGIYALDGDTLKVCSARGDADRPAEFRTRAGSETVLVTLKRDRQYRPAAEKRTATQKQEMARLRGTWAVQLVEFSGKPTTTYVQQWRIEPGKMEWFSPGKGILFTFEVNPDRDPREIDLEVVGGSFGAAVVGVRHRGIYRLDGATLKVCFGGKERPKGFPTKPRDDLEVIQLRRVADPPRRDARAALLEKVARQSPPKTTREEFPAYLKGRFQVVLPEGAEVINYHACVGLAPPNWDGLTWDYYAKIALTPRALAAFCKAWGDGPNPKGQRRHYEEDERLPLFGYMPFPFQTPREVRPWIKAASPWVFCSLAEHRAAPLPGNKDAWVTTAEVILYVSKKTNHIHLWAYERIGENKGALRQPGAAADPKARVLFSDKIALGPDTFAVQVTLRPHSLKPEGYAKDEPWMRGDLIEVRKARVGAAEEKPVVIWRHFYRRDTFDWQHPRNWRAAVCASPAAGELCLSLNGGYWHPMLFRVSLHGKPPPAPRLPKGFEEVKKFRVLTNEEVRKRYAYLGHIDLPEEVWQAFRKEDFRKYLDDYPITSLTVRRQGREVVITTNANTERAARFVYQWDEQKWRIEKLTKAR